MISCPAKRLFSLAAILFALANPISSQQAIQTQSHDTEDGIEADLMSVEIQNSVITLKFKLRNVGTAKQSVKIPYADCYIMDETNQKKYFALKDSDGLFIAGPSYDNSGGGRFWYDIEKGKSKGLWIKFPQPTDNPNSITVSLAGVSPFESVKLAK